MFVKDVMTSPVWTAQLGSSVRDVLTAMNEGEFRHVPVVDQGEVMGIVGERDLAGIASFVDIFDLGREAYENYLNLPLFKVLKKRFLVARDVVVVEADAPLRYAIEIFLNNRFHALPVVSGGKGNLVGILSYIDVLEALRPLV